MPSTVETASWPEKSTYTTPTTSLLPSVTNAVTATSGPLRTIIVRAAETQDHDARATQVIPDNQQDPILPNTDTDTSIPEDKTLTFYTLPLSGYHPAVLPLITTSHPSNTPLTLLAYANTTLYSSFISSSLVESLNLTSSITSPAPPSPLSYENDVTTLFESPSKVLGTVRLDILAGQADRMVKDWPFRVFEYIDGEGAEDDHEWKVDLWVGWTFLNEVQGVVLSEEYSGSREAGARNGVGVLVQRVFEGNDDRGLTEGELAGGRESGSKAEL